MCFLVVLLTFYFSHRYFSDYLFVLFSFLFVKLYDITTNMNVFAWGNLRKAQLKRRFKHTKPLPIWGRGKASYARRGRGFLILLRISQHLVRKTLGVVEFYVRYVAIFVG